MTADNIEKMAALFPNCITESKNAAGQLKKSIDFDLLKQELSSNIVEGPQERYQLNWPGKREALLNANAPIAKTLRPCREESVDFDNTENLFIEGDNLDALKLLQETYLGKIKMIYIDPPYNTGKDFIYSDNFAENSEEYLKRSQQKDEAGNRLIANTESNGRFHSDWLSMMYSRLKLARNLLRDDGVIFISIDDNENHNLRGICEEVFGEQNFLVEFAWRTDGNFDNQAKFKKCHEYVIGYAKREDCFESPPIIDPNVPLTSKLYKQEVRNTIVKNGPKNPESIILLPAGFPASSKEVIIGKRSDCWPHYLDDAKIKYGKLLNDVHVKSGWSSKDLLNDFISNSCQPILDAKGQESRFVISPTGAIEVIKKRTAEQSHVISFLQNLGGPQKAAAEIADLDVIFDDYPKPVPFVKYLSQMVKGNDHIVLDFFAGSATTAHAVMQLNAEDNGKRKFIMVQLPETCDEKSEAFKAGYATIAEISKERIRRAGSKIKTDNADKEGINKLDTGFRVLKVDSSNMAEVFYNPDAVSQDDLFAQVENIKRERSPEDLLFQVLLDWGVDLTLPISKQQIQGKTVFFVDPDTQGTALVACFDTGINDELIKTLARQQPLRVVFRDAGFGSSQGHNADAAKINAGQIFKQLSPATDVKTI